MISFTALLNAELRKTVDTRAARWLLAGTALLAMAAEAVPLVFTHDVTQTRASYLTWSALGVSRLLPIVLMMAMTAEWSQRTAIMTFTLEPRRGRVLAAKVISGLGIAAGFGCFAFLTALVTTACRHVTGGWDWPELAGFAVFVILTSAIGIAVGAALHSTAAAIVTYFALAAAVSLLMIPAMAKAGAWINTGQTFGWVLNGQWSGHGAQIAASAALWIALPLAIGAVRTIRREALLSERAVVPVAMLPRFAPLPAHTRVSMASQ
jgi:ABC-2 type transport system permease protein